MGDGKQTAKVVGGRGLIVERDVNSGIAGKLNEVITGLGGG